MTRHWLSLAVYLLVCALAAAVGAQFTPGAWYGALEKPPLTPPNVVFPIAWSILYVMIAWAGWRYWTRVRFGPVTLLWGIQLSLNAIWSWLFFGLHEPGIALFEIVLLWFAIAATVGAGFRVDRTASWAMAPYLAWVTFAAWLNYEIWSRNA